MSASSSGASAVNEALYDKFWDDCPDFSRYNPGARHRRRIITSLLSGLPGGRLLDVGCGDGELLMSLRRDLSNLTSFAGADLSSETVANNAARLPDMRFHVLDVAEGALDERFDLIVCSEVLEHLDDRGAAMRHLASMLAPGGHLLATCPTGHIYETERRFGHRSHPTVTELAAHGIAAGLAPVRAENWGFPLYKAMKWATNISADWAMKSFASGRYSASAKLVSNALYWANFVNLPSSERGCQLFLLLRRGP